MTFDTAFGSALLAEATKLVRANFPEVKLSEAWTYKFMRDHWEFHYKDFYWHGNASCSYEARYNGWMAWLRTKGVNVD
jgi:hypothetical protein